MPVKVLLVTTVRWPSAGRLAGAFTQAGCGVEVLLPSEHPATHSRYFTRVHSYRPMNGLVSFLDAMTAAEPDLVIPLDDRATSLLLRAHAEGPTDVALLIERSLGNIEAYPLLMSRGGFLAAAWEADIRTPLTFTIADEDELENALSEAGFPAVLKADGTWGGDGVFVVQDSEEARRAWRRLSDPPSLLRSLARAIRRSDMHHLNDAFKPRTAAVSLQKFVPGKAATTSLACWQGKLLAANHLETLASQETNGPASVLRRIDNAEMSEAASRLVSRFGLSGLHGLDYICDDQGRMHLLEINPRSPQSSYLNFGPGRDLIFALAGKLQGRTHSPRQHVPGDVVALFPQEWMRDPTSLHLKTAFHDVPWDDPALIRAWMSSQEARPALDKWRHFMADQAEARSLAAQA